MKRLAFLLLTCFACLAAQAQTYTAIKAGGGFSTLKYEIEDNIQARFGWYAGLSANLGIEEDFFVRTELLYSLRGYKRPATAVSRKNIVSYHYLSLPILGGYKPFEKFSIMAGPELGYLLAAKAKDAANNTDVLGFVSNRFSIDANLGAAYELTRELAIETHLLIGLTSLYRVQYTDANGNLYGPSRDGFNRMIQFGIIYKMSGN